MSKDWAGQHLALRGQVEDRRVRSQLSARTAREIRQAAYVALTEKPIQSSAAQMIVTMSAPQSQPSSLLRSRRPIRGRRPDAKEKAGAMQ